MTLEFLIGVAILVWAITFLFAWLHYHNKGTSACIGSSCYSPYLHLYPARKRCQLHGKPINHGSILKEACGVACVVGLICCLAETKAEAKANSGNNSGGGGDGGGNVDVEAQQPFMSQPMPSYQPQGMDWTPVNSVAQDGVQG